MWLITCVTNYNTCGYICQLFFLKVVFLAKNGDLQIVLNMLNYKKDKKSFKKYIDDNRDYFSKVTKETIVVLGLLLNAKNLFSDILTEIKRIYRGLFRPYK